jgi:hypothetical protein
VFAGQLTLVGATVELAEAEVAVGDEWPHPAFVGQRLSTPVAILGRLELPPIRMREDLTLEVQDKRASDAGVPPSSARSVLRRASSKRPCIR